VQKGTLPKRQWLRFKRPFIKVSNPYWALAVVLAILGIVALEVAATRLSDDTGSDKAQSFLNTSPAAPTSPISNDAWSYFHPTWQEETSWFSRSAQGTSREIRALISDPESRIEKDFQVPSSLKARVGFWMEIYARFNSRMRVVHDRNNPEVIYGYMDFRPIYRTASSTMGGDIKAAELEKKILKELKIRIQESAGLINPSLTTVAERDLIQKYLSRHGAASKPAATELLAGLRTQTGQADMFLNALYRSRQLLPHIESVFKRQGLPVGLGRIPFVESSFNPRALSKGGAVGIWQFMPETARQMIHAENEAIWADPLRQTSSAARLLKMYRSVLPDWGSTVTSYNSGIGRVRRIMTKYKVKTVEELLNIEDADGLGFAGKNFYSEFLAANLVEAYKEQLFESALEPADFSLVFKGLAPFPKEFCDI